MSWYEWKELYRPHMADFKVANVSCGLRNPNTLRYTMRLRAMYRAVSQ